MLCDHCKQNEAVIHLTQIEDNQMRTFHLCQGCAAAKGLEPGVSVGNVPLTDFLAQVGRGAEPAGNGPCAFCGLKLDEFKKTGRLGCSPARRSSSERASIEKNISVKIQPG